MLQFVRVFFFIVLLTLLISSEGGNAGEKDYCIIGAGPSGLQLGYFLHKAGRDYVIFERNDTAGSFYRHYPRHRTLISINKRNTGSTNKEFSFRHDWNSLITDDSSLSMRHYSKDYFPKADDYVRYLQDYASKQDLKIEYETEIKSVRRWVDNSVLYHLLDQNSHTHICRTVLVCTGLWKPHIPEQFEGLEHTMGYEDMTLDRDFFDNKKVLILGRGNAGFETADHIVGSTAFIHMASRSRIKLAYQTHYVGDLRTVNAEQVDTYQLKSLDGQFELGSDSEDGIYERVSIVKNEDGSLRLGGVDDEVSLLEGALFRDSYDIIIRCLGFKFDFSLFDHSSVRVLPVTSRVGEGKFPYIHPTYRADGNPDLYVGGAGSHSLDYKKSAGGFIHGHRYTARALFRHLEWHYDQVPWPSVRLSRTSLVDHLIRRINEASGPYQMFSVLADFMLIRRDGQVDYLEEVPVNSIPIFKEMTGHTLESFIVWEFEYGTNYSGPGHDVLRENRVMGDVDRADLSNFLHPVIYYYKEVPKGVEIGNMPKPTSYHHVVEDFLTDWTSRSRHIVPVRKFLENVFEEDLRGYLPEKCFELFFKHGDNVPRSCSEEYLQGLAVGFSDGQVDFGSVDFLDV